MDNKPEQPASPVLLLSTTPNMDVAESIARTLVGERLAACVNILPGLTSVFRWKGAIEKEQEHLLFIKTRASKAQAVLERLPDLHPYEVPEVIVLPINDGHLPYLQWISDATGPGPEDA